MKTTKYLAAFGLLLTLLTACTATTAEHPTTPENYGQAVAREYRTWVRSDGYKAWVSTQPPAPRFGYTMPCATFSKLPMPKTVKSCIQGPGPADGPTITLELVDGHMVQVDAS